MKTYNMVSETTGTIFDQVIAVDAWDARKLFAERWDDADGPLPEFGVVLVED